MNIKLITVLLGILTALFETIGALGSGMLWQSQSNKLWSLLWIILGFGGSITTYVFMRKFITDLVLAQAVFIGGTAIFAVITTIILNKFNVRWEAVLGIIFIALGAILINRVLPD